MLPIRGVRGGGRALAGRQQHLLHGCGECLELGHVGVGPGDVRVAAFGLGRAEAAAWAVWASEAAVNVVVEGLRCA